MLNYDALVAKADALRNKKKTNEAIAYYQAALQVSGQRDRYCKQMIGVCYKMANYLDEAESWLTQAAKGASGYEKGNIFRDLADVFRLQGDYIRAHCAILESLDRLPREAHPQEWGMSMGFRGRLQQEQLQFTSALESYRAADKVLTEERQLFNIIPYINLLSHLKHHEEEMHEKLGEAWTLCDRYGARQHYIRIAGLRIGGYRLDDRLERIRRRLHI